MVPVNNLQNIEKFFQIVNEARLRNNQALNSKKKVFFTNEQKINSAFANSDDIYRNKNITGRISEQNNASVNNKTQIKYLGTKFDAYA